eukprot:CAMPEP_0181314862 /NCGR_PEP_ID=MMETSP1101-20121128/15052_1 /TAXON_ID=46948 /ORGANISM="Rhodomonas abbreviata, Strain Caron Lab Isolate" /LENGTH=251 /DNA_ID=CAMNT_0023421999 /DNA_START=68 /DNA_END=819 /DNA_ORIENTATION=+
MSDERVRKAEALKKAKEDFLANNKTNSTTFFVEDKNQVSVTYRQTDLPELPAIHIRRCCDSTFTIAPETTLVKVLFEGCKNCKIILEKCVISTATMEMWRSDNCEVTVDCFLGTFQVDLCKETSIKYTEAKHLGTLVQAGMHDLRVSFLDDAFPEFHTGVKQLREEHGEVDEEAGQFITRVFEGKLLTEPIIRLLNDFPTTLREKAEFDSAAQKKAEAMEKLARDMLKDTSLSSHRGEQGGAGGGGGGGGG